MDIFIYEVIKFEASSFFKQFGYNKEINMQILTFVDAHPVEVNNKKSPYLAF